MTNSISQSWHNCYSEPWTNIQPEAFAHPAKFSSALIRRIYQHALERGYLKPGDTVLDPFGGAGLGSRDALANGLNWLGCELEQRFVDMGAGLECSGISKADWVGFYGRWEKMTHKDGRRWCPRCLAEARQVTESKGGGQLSFVEPLPSAAYTRNSGLIPETKPHYYQGNLDLFKKYARGRAWAVLLQGDSRRLVEIVSLRMGAMISSPPFLYTKGGTNSPNLVRDLPGVMGRHSATANNGYGHTEGQLSDLEEGSLPAAISSPPFASSVGSDDPDKRGGLFRDPKRRNDRNLTGSYGETEGQLGAMAQGEFDGAISSPPFTEAQTGGTAIYDQLEVTHKRRISPELRRSGYRADLQGDTPGQLASLPTGELKGVMKSPPFVNSLNDGLSEADRQKYKELTRCGRGVGGNYGATNGQLGAMPAGEPVEQMAGMRSSPPFGDQNACNDPKYQINRTNGGGPLHGDYGSAPGQLGGMAATISSPPFEASLESKDEKFNGLARPGRTIQRADYGSTFGQLGQESKETFWQAARQIVEQVYCLLKPNGVTIWVCKDFVRDGKLVPFCDQWRQLCEACGFEHLETFRAMLVKDNGRQATLDGGEVHLTKERKSFFRRLAEKKGSPRIDWEEVIILRKPDPSESDDQAQADPVQLGLEAL